VPPTPTLPATGGWTTIHSASFDSGTFASQFDAVSTANGSVTTTGSGTAAFGGSTYGTANITGSGGNGYARGQWEVAWNEGSTYRTEFNLYLPTGFYANQLGAIQLVGWDTYPTLENQMRLAIWRSDKRARLFLKSNNQDTELTNSFVIPEGQWVKIAIEQKISDTAGWSRVYMNDQLVAQGAGDTKTPYPVTRIRYGLVAIDGSTQTRPLTVHMDNIVLSKAN
jgi:hypothetical protein